RISLANITMEIRRRMKIPKNMSEQEVMKKIFLVVDRIAPKYTFNGYDIDDIKQEAYIICIDALDRYDENRPLENFLSVNLSNRLKNFVRDNYFTKNDEEKKKVLNPSQLSYDDCLEANEEDLDTNIDLSNISKIIDKHLPSKCRSDYLKILSDVYVPKKRKAEIISIIKNIMKEHGHA
ncbi:sigma-70 family RNA polymerase sigma factor, partial [bacterium]|nr:sigma-70 family RNA polymerase sigma factor [bacterium]